MPTDFSTLTLNPAMLANLESLGYLEMTPIQARSLPALLDNRDLIAQAKTGSGKTAAFGIGLLSKLDVKNFQVQALVLCPTRELADQVGKEIRRLARFTPNIKLLTLCGGAALGPQVGSLAHGAHIIVGTPGRIKKHLDKGSLVLDKLETLVLDEADRMLDMGFYDDIAEIIGASPRQRQTLLFSATYPDSIKHMSSDFQNDPLDIRVGIAVDDVAIEQLFFETDKEQRDQLTADLLAHYQPESAVIFCNTKQKCQDVADTLQARGFHAQALHGDMDQKDRDRVLALFANKSCPLLVATDVAARGLDIKDLKAVINYELAHDPEIHIHRIGRTGRAGKVGLALSLFTLSESHKVNRIEDYQKRPIAYGSATALAVKAIEIQPAMVTLRIEGGRKSKMRPGDILGALTGDAGIPGGHVGKIDIFDDHAYVAIESSLVNQALKQLTAGKIKGRKFKVRVLR